MTGQSFESSGAMSKLVHHAINYTRSLVRKETGRLFPEDFTVAKLAAFRTHDQSLVAILGVLEEFDTIVDILRTAHYLPDTDE